jgi:hypothetical protein
MSVNDFPVPVVHSAAKHSARFGRTITRIDRRTVR